MTPDEALAAYRLNQTVEYESPTSLIVPGRHACTIEAVDYGGSITVRNISKIHNVWLPGPGDCALLFLDPQCPPALTATTLGSFYYTTHCSNLYPQKPPVSGWGTGLWPGLIGGGLIGNRQISKHQLPDIDPPTPTEKAATRFPHTCGCGSPCYVGGGPQDIDCSNASCRHYLRGKAPKIKEIPTYKPPNTTTTPSIWWPFYSAGAKP